MTDTDYPESGRVRLLELISLACDDALSTDEAAALEKALRGSAAARQLYYEFINCHSQLCWPTAEMHSSAVLAASDSEVVPATVAGHAPNSSRIKSAQPTSPVLGFLGGIVDFVSQSRGLMFTLIFGALAIYFAAQLGSLLLTRFWAQNAPQLADGGNPRPQADAKRQTALAQHGAPAMVVARVTNAIDCRWKPSLSDALAPADQNSVAMDAGIEFHAGEKLDLTAGLAELTFESGAKVILNAPSRFTVLDPLGGDLQLGKLTAKVPHGAVGFSVKTPTGRVVDLGTEFGVKVNFDGTMHVTVYVGEVDVKGPSSGGGAASDSQVSTRVKAGQAVVLEPGKTVKPSPPDEERFIRDLAPLGDKGAAEAAYVGLMKSLKPAVWFRMEGKEADRTIHDEMGAARDGEVRWDGPGNPFVRGRIGKGLWLRGTKLRDHVYVADYPKADHNKLSVVAWVYAESRPNHATIAANWHEHTADGQFHFELISYNTDGGVDLCARIMPAAGGHILVNEGPTHPFPLNEWQHVAFTTDGQTLRLYRQGKEVGSLKHKGLLFPTPIPSLAIGACFNASDKTTGVTPGFWDGKIDELAIFNDALSADDVRKLASAAPH